jgi:hypothetical protein
MIISFKTAVLAVIFITILYYGSSYVSSSSTAQKDKTSLTASKGKAISCKPTEVFLNGACVELGPCGIRPSSSDQCDVTNLICDANNGLWRCKIPGETDSNPPPSYLGSCYVTDVKSDSNSKYYCPNETTVCNGNGSLYSDDTCLCNENYYGDGTTFNQCKFKCPEGTFLYQNNTCAPILPCLNGTFSKILNACVCNTGYYNKSNLCKQTPTCSGHGIFNTITERCQCNQGYSGDMCNFTCPNGQYYFNGNCTTTLACSVNGVFNSSLRRCDCTGNWTGFLCDSSRTSNCSSHGDPVLDAYGNFQKCKCDDGFYGPICKDTKLSNCSGRGTPQYNSNGQFTYCICDNQNDGGIDCRLTSAENCHGNGKVLVKSDDSFDKCQCGPGSTGPYCCLIDKKFVVTDTCVEKEPVCNKGPGDNTYGWSHAYRSYNEITNTASGWPTSGPCLSKCNFNTSNYGALLSYSDPTVTGNAPTVTCQKTCPTTIPAGSCAGCLNTSYATGDSVCLCDSGTSYNYQCRPIQADTQCAFTGTAPKLCADGSTPINTHCGNGTCLWHCAGYTPSYNVTDSYSVALQGCVAYAKNIQKNITPYSSGIWSYTPDGTSSRLPVYPTINNELCQTTVVNDYDQSHAPYYSVFKNPPVNVLPDGTKIDRNNYASNKNMLYNAFKDSTGAFQKLGNIGASESNQFNNGCFLNTTNSFDQDYCSGHGTFSQKCYKQNGTEVACGDASAVYKLKEGTCSCLNGYVGNRCQFSNAATCNGQGGTLTSTGTGTNALVGNDNYSCGTCSGEWTGANCNNRTCIGSWSEYDGCTKTCGTGTQTRTYSVTRSAFVNGVEQKDASGRLTCSGNYHGQQDTRNCNTQTCCSGHGTRNAEDTACSCNSGWGDANCQTGCGYTEIKDNNAWDADPCYDNYYIVSSVSGCTPRTGPRKANYGC